MLLPRSPQRCPELELQQSRSAVALASAAQVRSADRSRPSHTPQLENEEGELNACDPREANQIMDGMRDRYDRAETQEFDERQRQRAAATDSACTPTAERAAGSVILLTLAETKGLVMVRGEMNGEPRVRRCDD